MPGFTERVAFSEYHTGPDGTDRNVSSAKYQLTDASGHPYPIAYHAFAELDNGKALGGLPMGATIFVSIDGGGSAVLTKVDDGIGGPGKDGLPRAVDLFGPTVETLGLNRSDGLWTGVVADMNSKAAQGKTAPEGDYTPTQHGLQALAQGGAIQDILNKSLGPFLGLTGGQTIHDKMDEFVIRSVEVVAGSMIIAAGVVMFAIQFTGVSVTKLGLKGVQAYTNPASLTGFKLKDVAKPNRQGNSTKDVRDRVPGGMTKAQDRIAEGAAENVGGNIVADGIEGAAFA